MAFLREALGDAIRFTYCDAIRPAVQWLANLSTLYPDGQGPLANDRISRAICSRPPDEVTELPPPPFEGGQCDAQLYIGSATYVQSGTTQTVFFKAWGPIGGFITGSSAGTPGVGLLSRGDIIRTGTPYTCVGGIPPTLSTFQYRQFASGTAVSEPAIAGITACGLDDCGDPSPPPLPPPAPITIDVDITYEGDDSTEYNITVPVIFGIAYFDINGELKIPVSIGDLNFNGEISLNPEFNLEVTLPPGPGPGEPDDRDINPSPETGLDDDTEPLNPESTIIGVVVRSQRDGPAPTTVIFQSTGPDITAPRIANVRFLCRFGGVSAWTSDQPVKGVNEFIPCPSQFGAIDVVVNSESGWLNTFTPIRSKPLAEFEP